MAGAAANLNLKESTMAQRDDTSRQQQNGQRRGGNRSEHQKGDSQTTGKHVAQSEHDKAQHQQQAGGATADESAEDASDKPADA